MFDYIKNTLKPPGIDKKNRGKIFEVIGAIFEVSKTDTRNIFLNMFPFTADKEHLRKHADALRIPEFSSDTDDSFRKRVSTAADFLETQGERSAIKDFLNQIIPNRYELLEFPREGFRLGFSLLGETRLGGGFHIYVKVIDLMESEKESIYSYLDLTLSPDIEIKVFKA